MSPERPKVLATANTSWYLYNFRRGLLHRIRAAGWDVVLTAPRDEYSDRLADEGFEFWPIAIDSSGTNPFRDLLTIWAYFRLLRGTRAITVLSFTPKVVIYSGIAARLAGTATIATVTGLGSSFVTPGPVTHLVKMLYRFGLRGAAHVFFQNPDDLGLFRTSGLLGSEQSIELVGGSGVDLERFAPRPRNCNRGFTFLLAARMLRDKGIYEYAEAAARIRRTFPNTRFLLVGKAGVNNPSAISLSEIEGWVDEGCVEYLGDTDDIRPHIAASDVVVLPSYREGLPKILLEAASMRRPIVASDVSGCREIVIDGFNGFLCKARDFSSLADAMVRMLQASPQERDQMGARGRAMAVERFSEESVIAAYLSVIDRASRSLRKDRAPF